MRTRPDKSLSMRSLALLTAVIFFSQQVVWAGNLTPTSQPAVYEEIPSYRTADEFEEQNHHIDSFIESRNYIEEVVAAGSVLGSDPLEEKTLVATPQGHTAGLNAGELVYLETCDGIVLREVLMTHDGVLLKAESEHQDGGTLYLEDGRIVSFTDIEGLDYLYGTSNELERVVFCCGKTREVSEHEGGLSKLTSSGVSVFYDEEDALYKVVCDDGASYYYETGIPTRMVGPGGMEYLFDTKPLSEDNVQVDLSALKIAGNTYILQRGELQEIELSSGVAIREMSLSAEHDLAEGRFVYPDGSWFRTLQGKVTEFMNAEGQGASYSYLAPDTIEVLMSGPDGHSGTFIRTLDDVNDRLILREADTEYILNVSGQLEEIKGPGWDGVFHYSLQGEFTGAVFTSDDGRGYEYDRQGLLHRKINPCGTSYDLFICGPDLGRIKSSTKGEKSFFYEYREDGSAGMNVYQRTPYAGHDTFTFLEGAIPEQAPGPKLLDMEFTLKDPDSALILEACGEESFPGGSALSIRIGPDEVSLISRSVSGEGPPSPEERLDLPVDIIEGESYRLAFKENKEQIGIYLFKSGHSDPEHALYVDGSRLKGADITIYGLGCDIKLNETLSEFYTQRRTIRSDSSLPMIGDIVQNSDFRFDPGAARKAFHADLSTSNDEGYVSVSVSYKDGEITVRSYSYDRIRKTRLRETAHFEKEIPAGMEHSLKTVVEDGYLDIYILQAGRTEGEKLLSRHPWLNGNMSSDMFVEGGYAVKETFSQARVYEYSSEGTLARSTDTGSGISQSFFSDAYLVETTFPDGAVELYCPQNRLIERTFSEGDTAFCEYDACGSLLAAEIAFAEDAEVEYYPAGPFQGLIKTARFPCGKAVAYTYREEGHPKTALYRWESYDTVDSTVSYSVPPPRESAMISSFKGSFKLDPSKNVHRMNLTAEHFGDDASYAIAQVTLQDRRAHLLFLSREAPGMDAERIEKELDIEIEKGIEYILECKWNGEGVEVYIYESAFCAPTEPLHMIAGSYEGARFNLSGLNAGIALEGASNLSHARRESHRTDMGARPQGEIRTMTEFVLYPLGSEEQLSIGLNGAKGRNAFDSLIFHYVDGSCGITRNRHDSITRERTSELIPLELDLVKGVQYMVETVLQDGRLSVFVYEKGAWRGEAVYTEDNCDWLEYCNANIRGGEISLEVYHDMFAMEGESVLSESRTMPGSSGRMENALFFTPQGPAGITEHLFRASELMGYLPPEGADKKWADLTDKIFAGPAGEIFSPCGKILTGCLAPSETFVYDSATGYLKMRLSADGTEVVCDRTSPKDPLTGELLFFSRPDLDVALLASGILEALDDAWSYTAARTFYQSGRVHVLSSECGMLKEYADEDFLGKVRGRLLQITRPDGSYSVYGEYHDGLDQAGRVKEFSPAGELLRTIEYDADGAKIASYDLKMGDIAIEYGEDGSVTTFQRENGNFRKSTHLDGETGIFTRHLYRDGARVGFVTKEPENGVTEEWERACGKDGPFRLIRRSVAEENFIKGVNLPWLKYGYDLGAVPGSGERYGYAVDPERVYQAMALNQGMAVRVFLFCDLRSGINFTENGMPSSFTPGVFEDMRTLVDAAKAFNVRLIPVLFDYMIADGVSKENGHPVGEHAQLFNGSLEQQALLEIFRPFFEEFAEHENIYAWDIMNEPEYAVAAEEKEIKDFIGAFSGLIREVAPNARVTVGSRDIASVAEVWKDSGLDIYQVHHYDHFEESLSLDIDVDELGLNGMIIAGELEPSSVREKLDALFRNGYAGGLFWEDEHYSLEKNGRAELEEWFAGSWVEYSYYDSGRKHTVRSSDGLLLEYADEDFYDDGTGRLIKRHLTTGAWERYEYQGICPEAAFSVLYLPDGTLYARREYSDGILRKETVYRSDGTERLIRRSDRSWEELSSEGDLIRRGERVDDTDVVFCPDGFILELRRGSVREERIYVRSGNEILYTIAVSGGEVKGLVPGADQSFNITRGDTKMAAEGLTVDYDGLTATYFAGGIKALSAPGGYTELFNDGSTETQVASCGTLYTFEDGSLDLAATPSGNVYEFSREDGPEEAMVSLTGAVIEGLRCFFESGVLSSFHGESGEVHIKDMEIGNDMKITRLSVYRPCGEAYQELSSEDVTFGVVTELLSVMRSDIPNVRFSYSGVEEALKITTSSYGTVEFSKGFISRTVSAEGRSVEYEMISDNGEPSGFRVKDEEAVRVYDRKGDLVRIEFASSAKDAGERLYFTEGELSAISSGGSFLEDIVLSQTGEVEAARLITSEGSAYFFAGGRLEEFLDEANVEYELDAEGEIIRFKRLDTGEVYTVEREEAGDLGSGTTAFIAEKGGASYIYEEGMLQRVIDPAGLEIRYFYDASERTERIEIFFGGLLSEVYTYEYDGEHMTVTDLSGYERTFDPDLHPVSLRTPYNDTYLFTVLECEEGRFAGTAMNYSRKELPDGTVIDYVRGQIKSVSQPDGSSIDNVSFDPFSGKLASFRLHTACGEVHNVLMQGELVQIETSDGTRLIFLDDRLVAFGSSQGVSVIYDLEELKRILPEPGTPSEEDKPALFEMAASNWRHQHYAGSRGIRFVEPHHAEDEWSVAVDMVSGDPDRAQGEMFLDLRYDLTGFERRAPFDLEDKKISFLAKLGDVLQHDNGIPLKAQVFAKDSSWRTQYGRERAVGEGDCWGEVFLRPTSEDAVGHTDPGFDPSRVIMIGLRLYLPGSYPPEMRYIGEVKVKDNNPADLFGDASHPSSILDELYRSLGLSRDLDVLEGGVTDEDTEMLLSMFTEALAKGPAGPYQESMLRSILWSAETENEAIKGIRSVYRDTSTDELVLDVDLSSYSADRREGEVYFDLTEDVPFLGAWGGPINMASRPVSMLVKVPPGLIGAGSSPNGARLFVEDEDTGIQYGTWVNLKEPDKWYRLDLVPTFGEIPTGHTDDDFDPSRIKRIGLSIASPGSSGTEFEGEVRLKFPPSAGSGEVVADNMPLWSDLRGMRRYLVDGNSNYLTLPAVNYLPVEYFCYVLNRGNGNVPEADLSSIERSNTLWQSQLGGISGVGWDSSGDYLTAHVSMEGGRTVGEVLLDLRYGCYVPDKNWQERARLDLTGQQITFYVRAAEGFSASSGVPLAMEAFAKDSPAWDTQFGGTVMLDPTGEWTKVTLNPLPTDFSQGYVSPGFDPEKVIALGLRLRSLSPAYGYSGKVDIRYEINDVTKGLVPLDGEGQYPAMPVWTDVRKMAAYLRDNEFALYASGDVSSEIKRAAAALSAYALPQDMAAFVVYDRDERPLRITKPDGTTTYFDDKGRMDRITFESGEVFVDHRYGPEGRLVSSRLDSARKELENSMLEITLDINRRTADSLLLLGEQGDLICENFLTDVNAQRAEFERARAELEEMRYQRVRHVVKLLFIKFSYYTVVEVPGVWEEIKKLDRKRAEFERQVAEELARLDGEIDARKREVTAESRSLNEKYAWQGEKMLMAIRRQEAIPVVFYYYRNVLGRDPSEDELAAIFRRISVAHDFAGVFTDEITCAEKLITSLQGLEGLLALMDEEIAGRIVEWNEQAGEALLESVLNALDELIRKGDLYEELYMHYASLPGGIENELSEDTLGYLEEFRGDAEDDGWDAEEKASRRMWLNRYIVQDLCAGISPIRSDVVPFSAQALSEELYSSQEHAHRKAFKKDVTSQVMVFLEEYLENPMERDLLLTGVGLSPDETIEITEGYVSAVEDWLEAQDLHFARSAFGSLKQMLSLSGLDVTLSEIAVKAITIDVISGAAGPLTDRDVEISMFAMDRICRLWGLDTDSARIKHDDIDSLDAPFVALVDRRHYVTVTFVDEEKVTYRESNLGAAGGEVTVKRRQFEDRWRGEVIASGGVPSSSVLSVAEAKKIKGAFFGMIIAGIASFVLSTAAAVVSSAVGAITALVKSLGTLMATAVSGLAHAVANVGSILSFAGEAFLGVLGGVPEAAGFSVSGFNLSSMVTEGVLTLTRVGVSYGISCGLSAAGVDPAVTGMVSSILTGGAEGVFSGGGLEEAFRTAMEYGAYASSSLLGAYFDLDPFITRILNMSTADLFKGILDPEVPFGKMLESVPDNIERELLDYGVSYAAGAAGLKGEVGYLASMGISSSLRAGLGNFGSGGLDVTEWFDEAASEFASPQNLALAMSVASDATRLPPLLDNMLMTAALGAASGFYKAPGERVQGLFKGMFDTFWEAGIRALTFGTYDPAEGGWNRDIKEEYFLMDLTRFADMVLNEGLVSALERHVSGVFRDEAIRAINRKGGISDVLTGKAEMVFEDGVWLNRVTVTDEDRIYLDPETDNIVGRDYGNVKERGEYGVNRFTGGFGLVNGFIEKETEYGTRIAYHVSGSVVVDKIEFYGEDGTYLRMLPIDVETGLELDRSGVPIGAIVEDIEGLKLYEYEYVSDRLSIELNFPGAGSELSDLAAMDSSSLSMAQKEEIVRYYLLMNGIGNPNAYVSPRYMYSLSADILASDPFGNPDITLIPLYNDIAAEFAARGLIEVSPEPYELFQALVDTGYVERLGDTDWGRLTRKFYETESDIEMAKGFWDTFGEEAQDIYEFLRDISRGWMERLGGKVRDMVEWCFNAKDVAGRIYANLRAKYGTALPDEMTGVCYSGSGDPFLYLLSDKAGVMDVKSVILVGTPIRAGREIMNPGVETVVNIFGERDEIYYNFNRELRGGDFDGVSLFEHVPSKVSEFAIELKGVGHGDYFYDPASPGANYSLARKASRFIAEVARLGNDKEKLEGFLDRNPGIIRDTQSDKYIVDLEKVVYDEHLP